VEKEGLSQAGFMSDRTIMKESSAIDPDPGSRTIKNYLYENIPSRRPAAEKLITRQDNLGERIKTI
jgi:hypothetical protein